MSEQTLVTVLKLMLGEPLMLPYLVLLEQQVQVLVLVLEEEVQPANLLTCPQLC